MICLNNISVIAKMNANTVKPITCLLVFSYPVDQHELRWVEFACLVEMFSSSETSITFRWFGGESKDNVFAIVETNDIDLLRKVASRSVLLKHIYLLLAQGETPEQCAAAISSSCPELVQLQQGIGSFRFDADAFGMKMTPADKQAIREIFLPKLGITAPVSLLNPTFTLAVWMNGTHSGKAFQPQCWFGLHIVSCVEGPAIVEELSLKKRPFMSPTAMPSFQAAIMAICALIREGCFAWDPFCGSGSIMLMLAKMGAIVIGSDMDWRYFKKGQSNAKKGGSKEATLRGNFEHYGLSQPLLVRADIGHLPFGHLFELDAIVCDPPYGIRAGTLDTSDSGRQELLKIIARLLEAAAKHLRIGGRLVFFQPTTEYGEFSDEVKHPALRLLYAPLERIHDSWSRRLVVMEKVRECEKGMKAVLPEESVFKRQKNESKRQKTGE
jgi:tRNA (guanine10-N2)-methyltransferase